MEKYTDAVFDLDNTLIDSKRKIQTDTIDAFRRLGIIITPDEIGKDWYATAKKYGISKERFDEAFDKRKTWERSLRDGDAPIFPETHAVLTELKKRSIRISILSKSLPKYTKAKLDYFHLTPYFAEILTIHPRAPDKKQGALKLIKTLNPETTAKAYFIGDKEEDVTVSEDVRKVYNLQTQGIYVNRNGNKLNGFPSLNSLEGILELVK